ncbi:MAG: 3-deoxy-D-manno-octulosonate 8-phosphate phosphatase KdsC [Legionellaceae bacterium]
MQENIARAQEIKLLVLDVDGVLSNGHIYIDDNGIETKAFHVQDGLGIELLQAMGIIVAVISGRNVPCVTHRIKKMGVKYLYQGHPEKLPIFQTLLNELSLKPEQVACIGDDLVDIPLFQRAGLSITVQNANEAIFPYVHWITNANGGKGAVREVCEFLLKAQNKWENAISKYISI